MIEQLARPESKMVLKRVRDSHERIPESELKRRILRANSRTKEAIRNWMADARIDMEGPVTIITDVGPVEFEGVFGRDPRDVLNDLKQKLINNQKSQQIKSKRADHSAHSLRVV